MERFVVRQLARWIGRATLAMLALACRHVTGPESASPEACARTTFATDSTSAWPSTVTGCWLQPGVDTYAQFHLVQQGTSVSGTFSICGAVTGCATSYRVSGAVAFPHMLLQWTEQAGRVTFDATVTPDANTLAGVRSVNGGTPAPRAYFWRTTTR